jgi:hypothetical protein
MVNFILDVGIAPPPPPPPPVLFCHAGGKVILEFDMEMLCRLFPLLRKSCTHTVGSFWDITSWGRHSSSTEGGFVRIALIARTGRGCTPPTP